MLAKVTPPIVEILHGYRDMFWGEIVDLLGIDDDELLLSPKSGDWILLVVALSLGSQSDAVEPFREEECMKTRDIPYLKIPRRYTLHILTDLSLVRYIE